MDWINNKIYWTDSLTKAIKVSDPDGSNWLALIWSDMELPRPIVLDPFNRSAKFILSLVLMYYDGMHVFITGTCTGVTRVSVLEQREHRWMVVIG